jgi:NAD(P)H-dependent flavin oxidoreductase YrpB (nitropropane dioxygenase family)
MAPRAAADLLSEIGVERPVVQAGMAGGVAGGELAGAVSAAGGLGTVGMMGVKAFASALSKARRGAGGRPVAANLLVPFIRAAHVRVCAEAGVALVVLHGGRSQRWLSELRRRGLCVLATVGTPQEAVQALADGVDGLVVQGAEAGGHLVGVEPIQAALPRIRELAGEAPLLAAGGVAEAADVRRLLDLGADAVVAGTRFLLTEESLAHELYKQRVLAAERTLATDLFGFGWPMRHRVVPNAATERWCASEERGPLAARLLGRLSAPVGRLAPMEQMGRLASVQRVGVPVFSPALPLQGMPDASTDRCALYAGDSALRMHDVVPARRAVEQLAP